MLYIDKLYSSLHLCNFKISIINKIYNKLTLLNLSSSTFLFFCLNIFFYLHFINFWIGYINFNNYVNKKYILLLNIGLKNNYYYFFTLKHLSLIFLIWNKLKFTKKFIIKFNNHNIFFSISNLDKFHFQKPFSMGRFLIEKSKFLDLKDTEKKKLEHNWYDEQISLYLNSLKNKQILKVKKKKEKYQSRYGINSRKNLHHFKTLIFNKIHLYFTKFKLKKVFKIDFWNNINNKVKYIINKSYFGSKLEYLYPNLYWSTHFTKSSSTFYNIKEIDRVYLIFKNFNYKSFIKGIFQILFNKSIFIQFVENFFSLKFGGTKFKKIKRGYISI